MSNEPLHTKAEGPEAGWGSRLNLRVLGALFVLWVFCNPFFAVDRGSLIYIGRAFADLDPSGVGQDIMFRYDGQSEFTLFTLIFHAIAAALGLSWATYIIAATSVVSSFIGAVVLAHSMVKTRTACLVIVFAAALPAYYGGYKFFSYAESAATPRPFAETFVLCGLAALLHRRYALSFILLACATLLHPIMALAGMAVLALWMIFESRGWLVVFITIAAAAAGLIFANQALFSRVAAFLDPEWRAILVDRNPHLFLSLWLNGWFGRAATRTATIFIAASLISSNVRRLFLITVFIGYFGLVISYFFGEKESLLIVIQAQTWRMTWLIFAIGTAAAAICVIELWQRGGTARIVLLLLASAWAWSDNDAPALLLSTTAFIVHYTIDPKEHPLRPAILGSILAVLSALSIIGFIHTQAAIYDVTATAPPGLANEGRRMLALQEDYTPLAIAASLLAFIKLPPFNRALLGILSGTAALVVFSLWDQRSLANKYFDSDKGAPGLGEIIAGKPGEIYWIGGLRENWWWLNRPNWVTSLQGAGIVFSHDLALLYHQRVQRAVDYGLAKESLERPFKEFSIPERLEITQSNVDAFCAFRDAPAWIIAPFGKNTIIAPEVASVKWHAPIGQLVPSFENGAYHWELVSRFAVIGCAT